ncbi:MAG: PLP-dependent aminotransferase family protein [Clostridia bacterium]|nr:PLP-dependent aminotransferase family protein [Clostridia bacterium]
MEYKFADKVSGLKPSAIREIFKSLADPTIISFAGGNPNPASFPVDIIGKISSEIFSDPKRSTAALQYSVTEGFPPLVEKLTKRQKEKFGMGTDRDKLIITTGGQQAADLVCKVLCNEGDIVICEDPSFIGAMNAFRANGAKLVGVPMQDDGIDTALLRKAIEQNKGKVKLIYVIPNFQNPAGLTMSEKKRREVYEIAKEYGIMIFEDNPYGELRFAGQHIAPIKTLDKDGLVLYCSSFSKILSAGMRIGYLQGPEEVIQKVVVAKQVNDVHTNIFFQMVCDEFIGKYDLDKQIASICELYGKKCALMLGEMDKKFPKEVKYTRPEGGLFLWCTLPDHVDVAEFVKRALERKVAVVTGAAFLADTEKTTHCFRMNYSMPTDEQIVQGVEILSEVMKEMI